MFERHPSDLSLSLEIVGQAQAGTKQEQHTHCEHQAGHKAWRMRGGGAAKVKFQSPSKSTS